MTIEDDIAFLERIPILRQLGTPALRMLAIGGESVAIGAGEQLFRFGDAADSAYIVQRGSFRLRPERPGGHEVIAGPGTLIGESALLAETARPATATAREDSAVLRISRSMFLKMLEGYPDAAARLRELIMSRADQWTREVEGIRDALARGTKPE
ncbi:MAG TPA: cyclic nucleotide-binding domain-containing protein [Xanthobacteraceae bacterium]|nr:cyclic nucleotide-binding domain-containing protein [Xanthobacteraceae bacterium]